MVSLCISVKMCSYIFQHYYTILLLNFTDPLHCLFLRGNRTLSSKVGSKVNAGLQALNGMK